MNIGTILTPMTRGQITLPKAYRDKLGITPGTPLNVTLAEDKIIVQPLVKSIRIPSTPLVIKPKYTRKQYGKVLQKVSRYMEAHGPLWTKDDDQAREIMKKKEKKSDW